MIFIFENNLTILFYDEHKWNHYDNIIIKSQLSIIHKI